MKLDFSKFKKIETDDKATTLEHEAGHHLKIAHKGLSSEMRKELEQLPLHKAKGGFAKHAQRNDPNINKKVLKPEDVPNTDSMNSGNSQPSNVSKPMPEPSYTEPENIGTDLVVGHMNKPAPGMGTPPDPSYHSPPCINPSCKSYGKAHPNCRCYGGKMGTHGGYAEGGEVDSFCSQDRPHDPGCQYYASKGMVDETPPVDAPPDEAPQDQPAQPQPDAQPQPSEQDVIPDQQAPAPAEQAQPQTPVDQFQQHKANAMNDLVQEGAGFESDLNAGHIKPETYHDLFAKKDTIGKLGSIFGLLMSGAGAGLTGQPNMLMEMWNKEIDRDLDAQQKSVGNKQNFLKINQQNTLAQAQAGTANVETASKAYALSKAMMNMSALHSLVGQVQKMPIGSPQRQMAENTLAMLNQSVQNENFNLADRAATASAFYKTMGKGGNNTQMLKSGLFGPEAAKIGEDVEQKSIPGIPGQAAYPLSPGDKDEIGSGVTFDKQLKNFIDWTSKHSGDINPSDKKYGQSLAAQLQGAYRQATHGGVYKEGEQNFISKIITDNPTQFFNKIRSIPQLRAVQDDLHNRLDQSLKNKGFSGYQSQKSYPEGTKGKRKDGTPIIFRNGQWANQ